MSRDPGAHAASGGAGSAAPFMGFLCVWRRRALRPEYTQRHPLALFLPTQPSAPPSFLFKRACLLRLPLQLLRGAAACRAEHCETGLGASMHAACA